MKTGWLMLVSSLVVGVVLGLEFGLVARSNVDIGFVYSPSISSPSSMEKMEA